jgi:phosphoglycolate phosphatase-like HAD superfamily hydrolase
MTTWANSSAAISWLSNTFGRWLFPNELVTAPARKSVIFDFDGTIADSFAISLEVGNRLAQEYGIEPVTPEKLDRWRHMTAKAILNELNLPMLQLPCMLHRFKRALQAEVSNFPFFLGMRETILELWDQDYVLGVVTSNSAENVRQFLNHQGIGHLFEFVESCPYYLGKQRVLRSIACRHQLDLEKMLYVGDETRDIDAAKQILVQSVAVTWGFNSAQALREHHPDYLIDQPRELLAITARLK